MTTFLSAGHNPKGIKKDNGAVGNGYKEADLTVELRDLVLVALQCAGIKIITDKDDETLAQYLGRIKTGNGSVVLEFHFDAAGTSSATGSTAIIGSDADRLDRAFAEELVERTAEVLGVRNRGVITEAQSHRGRLGLMRKQGTVALLEVCFITNSDDIKRYQDNKHELACALVPIIVKYEKRVE